ncbi:N-acetylmuramoyl-L-alanine amidase [Halanaerobium saccharolyticum]|uniref:N-acetylmuramoyl-L-alanine amidase n=1 Tax=Halanaerobium saccharolyticum TaxID=43595 RepID=A0A4R7Z6R1_9FIRM|nr:cell wall hydrolase [Halanaerobium saccharolyticum]RAK11192.1 N-acetylmuramoyl-L-alanine amidase [Halanaerobium saccharolyticum]TDW07043.1 N-acetylmuramoyl-L-alanine amidase [Halanaerobium saccharolyticum]TDX63808.1 N-acetylmuramoyl-L-alanine amidase [Halanaerobium saccharolyticum]
MQRIHFKKIIISLALIMILNAVFLPYIMPSAELKAASIEKEDIYTGLGLMFLLVVLSGGGDNKNEAVRSDDFHSYKNFSADEIEILASIINAEARGESYDGKVAVGAVIINRVYHPSFPNSIREVVYQSGQFTPVENGMINLSPDSDSFKAAYDAVSGLDPSQGSLYFYNPAKSRNPSFFAGREKVVTIGNHVFLK